ncbi:MAG: fumarate/nitrate reduction transcriptional regulator Fnr [Gammaproteobacteria bacterium]|nr:fumarate/nitrate reduction transcriptional regulator Fnr [Gammaproteobacteria bacterium]
MAQPEANASQPLEARLKKRCSNCSLSELCLPMGLDRIDVEQLDDVVDQSSPMHAGDHLYRKGDGFKALYAVRSGYLKTYIVDETGREQVLGFYLPGELVGLDAIYPEKHQCNAVALDTATVCELPYEKLSDLAEHLPSLQKQMFRLLSKDITSSQALTGDFTAEERLAAFLLGMSARLKVRGYSPTHFLLAMPRRDIANYLRLATETVSRVFKRFQKEGLIEVDRRDIRLLDLERLDAISRCVPR